MKHENVYITCDYQYSFNCQRSDLRWLSRIPGIRGINEDVRKLGRVWILRGPDHSAINVNCEDVLAVLHLVDNLHGSPGTD